MADISNPYTSVSNRGEASRSRPRAVRGRVRRVTAPDMSHQTLNEAVEVDVLEETNSNRECNVYVRARMTWSEWMVLALCECMKIEYESVQSAVGRECIVSADQRWRKIQCLMKARGVLADISQLRNKWEIIAADYKWVRDHNHGSGNVPYSALDSRERKEKKLPMNFPDEWMDLLDSFYGHRPSINPPCVVESLEEPEVPMNAQDQPLSDSSAEHGSLCHHYYVNQSFSSGYRLDIYFKIQPLSSTEDSTLVLTF